MLNKTSNFVVTFLVTLLITAGLSFAQNENSKEQNYSDMKDHNMNHETMMDSSKMHKDHKHMDHDKMMGSDNKEVMKDSKSIVHKGTVDLAAIDENGDGKVYQDQMCWNVVSDKSGECPQCGMILKDVSLEEAKANLEENGFEVK
jgi:hypothetical protein